MTDTLLPYAPPERWVPLQGAVNFRDVGGYLTASGATVRWRRLFRSDALDDLTVENVQRLTASLGLHTVLDLRCAEERAATGSWSAARHELPIFELPSIEPVVAPGVALHDVYLNILRRRADRIREVLVAVVESEHPLVFHCSAGKDRTGLISAVLLGALGVSDDDISRDYALTGLVLPLMATRLQGLPPVLRTADRATMQSVLRTIRSAHGSMLGYVLDIGVGAEAIANLRDRLLD